MKLKVRETRKQKGLTIMQLANLSDVSRSHISEIENQRQMPSIYTICRLAVALDVSPEVLYSYSVIKK